MAEKQRKKALDELRGAQPLDEPGRAGNAPPGGAVRELQARPAGIDVRDIESRMNAKPPPRPTMKQISGENALIGQQIINTWLTDDFFAGTTHSGPGPSSRDNFTGGDPKVVTKPSNWFWQFEKESGFVPTGVSPYGGTWLGAWLSGREWEQGGKLDVFVSSSVLSMPDRYTLITHELLHSAAEANGGMEQYYIGDGGRRVSLGNVRWFHEGTTELFAQELVRAHGMTPSYVSYPYETMTCFLIQGILIESYGEEEGRRMMRNAYLTGDMSIIRNTVDATLGRGTFERLMGMDRGAEGADEIFTFMRGRAGASLMSWGGGTQVTYGWERNPIIAHILRELEDPRAAVLRLAELMDRERGSRQR
ncbi:MAG TPA: hypothetical protein VLD37_00665 [Candidatus Bilamarchaeum sp.]|nr:hypothetical protein [Candidatus Bilamarchaeum sp.]